MSLRRTNRLLKVLGVGGALAMTTLAGEDTSRADSQPALAGYAGLGQVLIDKNGCSGCPAVFTTGRRYRAFALVSDTPFPINQTGRVDVTCGTGTSYHVFLQSSVKSGPFQLIPNNCVGLDSKEVKLTITSVSLSAQDAEKTVALMAYGAFS